METFSSISESKDVEISSSKGNPQPKSKDVEITSFNGNPQSKSKDVEIASSTGSPQPRSKGVEIASSDGNPQPKNSVEETNSFNVKGVEINSSNSSPQSTSKGVEVASSDGNPQSKSGGKRKRSRSSSRKKRPDGMPKRPLSAYNIFYKREKPRVMEESTVHVGYKDLGRIIGKRWRTLNEDERRECERLAEKEVIHYRREMEIYKAAQSQKEIENAREEQKNKLYFPGKESKAEQSMHCHASQYTSYDSPVGTRPFATSKYLPSSPDRFWKKGVSADDEIPLSPGSVILPDRKSVV